MDKNKIAVQWQYKIKSKLLNEGEIKEFLNSCKSCNVSTLEVLNIIRELK